MRKIISLQPVENFLLNVTFDNGSKKTFDIKPYLSLPVFAGLCMPNAFSDVTNMGYFIEWKALEIDLSADTIWHEGK